MMTKSKFIFDETTGTASMDVYSNNVFITNHSYADNLITLAATTGNTVMSMAEHTVYKEDLAFFAKNINEQLIPIIQDRGEFTDSIEKKNGKLEYDYKFENKKAVNATYDYSTDIITMRPTQLTTINYNEYNRLVDYVQRMCAFSKPRG